MCQCHETPWRFGLKTCSLSNCKPDMESQRPFSLLWFIAVIALLRATYSAQVASTLSSREALERNFQERIHPFFETYCFTCHGKEKAKGDLDLSAYATLDSISNNHKQWGVVLEQLKAGEMPPEKAKLHPTSELRAEVIEWIQSLRRFDAARNAGDPGIVLARRLSNAEFDYTIRDLTGVDIRPAKEFPVDPANQSGFDNTGESLSMSPSLVKKYLEAARNVADHLVLKPHGFSFAPHPIVTDPDRDKYCVKRIIQFYQRLPTNYVDYFFAAWRYQYRQELGRPDATLADIARERRVSAKYLTSLWSALNDPKETIGPMAALQILFRDLPPPQVTSEAAVRERCVELRNWVGALREPLRPEFANLRVRGVHEGSQPLVLWKDRQYATNRMNYIGKGAEVQRFDGLDGTLAGMAMSLPIEPEQQQEYEASFKRFCALFPDSFYVAQRARVYLDQQKEQALAAARFLSAGFHSQVGYFRDDEPLCKLVLDDKANAELDELWLELNFITFAPARQHRDFLWFERTDSRFLRDAEFDFARPEDNDSISESKIKRLSEVYLAKARQATTNPVPLEVIRDHFERVSANIRAVEQARAAAEPSHLEALEEFAERAYRRPLTPAEREDLRAFYAASRKEGLNHEEAIRDGVTSVLMSPHFMYRIDLGSNEPGVRPLSDYALASRLSYFLWSSMPDQELIQRAAAGELHRPEVLLAQAHRMLQDDRARALAIEFGGNWLDFRRFEEHNSVDRGRFPAFNNELRQAMFEEPVRFFVDLIQRDGSILDFISAKHTFVNPVLARHYGMPHSGQGSNDWIRVDNADRFERGGVLPMAVFLTKNAPGLRTSPVKRGYWVVRRLLGEYIPAPPPNVGELPSDEAKLNGLTLRETLERHRAEKSCATCHSRFDSLGLVFEGYGPVGERRMKDLAGQPVDTHATFPRGGEGNGLEGLRQYLQEHRESDFIDNFSRKFLSYALGRGLIPSDDSLIEDLHGKLAANGFHFSVLADTIITSPQFLTKRGQGALTMN